MQAIPLHPDNSNGIIAPHPHTGDLAPSFFPGCMDFCTDIAVLSFDQFYPSQDFYYSISCTYLPLFASSCHKMLMQTLTKDEALKLHLLDKAVGESTYIISR